MLCLTLLLFLMFFGPIVITLPGKLELTWGRESCSICFWCICMFILHPLLFVFFSSSARGARWLSGRVSDSGARGPGFETYLRRVVSLSKTLYSPKVLVNYPGSDGSVPI